MDILQVYIYDRDAIDVYPPKAALMRLLDILRREGHDIYLANEEHARVRTADGNSDLVIKIGKD
jgi:hypothetical protein